MEQRNVQPLGPRQGHNGKFTSLKEGATTKGLSGLSLRPTQGRAPLVDISTNRQNTNRQREGGHLIGSKSAVRCYSFVQVR